MGIIKTVWNLVVLSMVVSFFGLLASVTLKLGYSALDLHRKGLLSLSNYNRSLLGNETLGGGGRHRHFKDSEDR